MKSKQKQSQRSISSETAHRDRLLPSSSSSLFSLSSSGKSVIANLAAASSSLISSTVSPTVAVHPLPETLKRGKSSKRRNNNNVTPRVDTSAGSSGGGNKHPLPSRDTNESIYSTNQQQQQQQAVNAYSTVSTGKNTTVTSLTHVTPLYTCNNNSRSHLIIPQSDLGTFRTLLSGWETVTTAPPAASSSSLNTNYESSSLRSSSSLGIINSRSSALANRELFLYGTPSSCETSPMSFNYPGYSYTVPATFNPVTLASDSVTSTSSSYRHASVDRLNSRKSIYERAGTALRDQGDLCVTVKPNGGGSGGGGGLAYPSLMPYSGALVHQWTGDHMYQVDKSNQLAASTSISAAAPTVTVNLPSTSSSESSKSNLFIINHSDIIDDQETRDKYINLTSKVVGASFTPSTSSHVNGEENLFNTRADTAAAAASYNNITGRKVFLSKRQNDADHKQVRREEGGRDAFDSLFNQNNEIELRTNEKANQPSTSFTTSLPFTPSRTDDLRFNSVAEGGGVVAAAGETLSQVAANRKSNGQVKQPTAETYGKFKVSSVTVNPQNNIESSPLPSSSTGSVQVATTFSSSLFNMPVSAATINPLTTAMSGGGGGGSGSGSASQQTLDRDSRSNQPLMATFTGDKYLTKDSAYNVQLLSKNETNNTDDYSRGQAFSSSDAHATTVPSSRMPPACRDNDDKFTANSEQLIGFAHYPVQVYKKIVKKGFKYNLMIVGESGTGKSTGVNCLFHTDIYSTDYPGPSVRASGQSTVSIESTRVLLRENNIKIDLTVTDTPGFACAMDNNDCFVPIVDFIDDKYKEYFENEISVHRSHITDNRVHALLYFIAPSGHSLKQLDIEVMKQLSEKVNIIPIISKADAFTSDELIRFKSNIRNDLDVNRIKYVKFFRCSSGNIHTPDLGVTFESCSCVSDSMNVDGHTVEGAMAPVVPFALIGSNYIYHNPTTGECTRLRKYPWGSVQVIAECFGLLQKRVEASSVSSFSKKGVSVKEPFMPSVENTKHSDFLLLRNILLKDHLLNLVNYTNDTLYESYRISQLKRRKEKDASNTSPSVARVHADWPHADTEENPDADTCSQ